LFSYFLNDQPPFGTCTSPAATAAQSDAEAALAASKERSAVLRQQLTEARTDLEARPVSSPVARRGFNRDSAAASGSVHVFFFFFFVCRCCVQIRKLKKINEPMVFNTRSDASLVAGLRAEVATLRESLEAAEDRATSTSARLDAERKKVLELEPLRDEASVDKKISVNLHFFL
jgi:multidrug efflux pump subunit AcrA (membrane-fusion protein)